MIDRACTSPLVVLAETDACHLSCCRYNIAEDVEGHRCALVYADRGGMTLDEIAALLHLTRERIRQIEEEAMGRKAVRAMIRRLEIAPDDYAHAEAS